MERSGTVDGNLTYWGARLAITRHLAGNKACNTVAHPNQISNSHLHVYTHTENCQQITDCKLPVRGAVKLYS